MTVRKGIPRLGKHCKEPASGHFVQRSLRDKLSRSCGERASSPQAAYHSLPPDGESSLAPLRLLSPQSLTTLRGPLIRSTAPLSSSQTALSSNRPKVRFSPTLLLLLSPQSLATLRGPRVGSPGRGLRLQKKSRAAPPLCKGGTPAAPQLAGGLL